MKMTRYSTIYPLVSLILIVMLSSCGKEGGLDCFKSTGETRIEERFVPPFHTIEVFDNINLVLTQDTLLNSMEVEAGENLLKGITTEVDSGRLFLRNENTCNWVRSFEVPINIYISFSSLDTIIFRAAGNLRFTTPWKNDSIQFDVWEGAGKIELDLDVIKSKVYVHYGVVDVNISGTSEVSYLSNKGYGPINALDLKTNYTYMSTLSPNDCFVNVRGELGVTINNIGNVYYKGNPVSISEQLNSSGRLIKLE